MRFLDENGHVVDEFSPPVGEQILSTEVSDSMRYVLESVVSSGTGQRTYIAGYRVGAKTATSQKLPRGSGKYISSIMAFAPADAPAVVALVLVDEPKGLCCKGRFYDLINSEAERAFTVFPPPYGHPHKKTAMYNNGHTLTNHQQTKAQKITKEVFSFYISQTKKSISRGVKPCKAA
jgi:hypothetical protein